MKTNKFIHRDGTPYSSREEWVADVRDNSIHLVAENALDNFKLVKTLWWGIDHDMSSDSIPWLFETTVYNASGKEIDKVRYRTEQEALDGHDARLSEHS